MNDQIIGAAYMLVTVGGLLGVRSASFTERFGKRNTGMLLIGVGMSACFIMSITQNPWLSVLSILALRISFSLLMPLVQLIQNQQVQYKNRATALSINSFIMDGVAVGTNLAFGKICDINLIFALLVGMVFCTISIGLFTFSTKRMQV